MHPETPLRRREVGTKRRGRQPLGWKSGATIAVLIALLGGGPSPAAAQTDERVLINPKPMDIRVGTAPKSTLMALPPQAPRTSEKQLDLNIVYTDSAIYNPGTGRKDRVRLRSYVGAEADSRRPYVAPTIEVAPGDTVRITLHNKLPADPHSAGRRGRARHRIGWRGRVPRRTGAGTRRWRRGPAGGRPRCPAGRAGAAAR